MYKAVVSGYQRFYQDTAHEFALCKTLYSALAAYKIQADQHTFFIKNS